MEGKIITNEIRFYPLLVSSNGLEKQSDQEGEAVWNKLELIPLRNKEILLSANIIENLYNAEKKFGWDPYYSARLSYLTRELLLSNISQTEFYKAIEAQFIKQFGDRFNEILNYVNNTILTSQPDPDEEAESPASVAAGEAVKQFALLDALAKYPNLANQNITSENIKLKSQVALVRPTLTNWLKNYRDELGIGLHDSVTRAKFLFESLNTKKLPSEERDRLHAIIRSIEDNEPLNIDTQKQEILFIVTPEATPAQRVQEEAAQSPDIFERFQNVGSTSPLVREDLQGVGTPTYTQSFAIEEDKSTEPLQNKQIALGQEAVMSKIKNIFTPPKQEHAPAPVKDFMPEKKIVSPEPLGTLRFSAKQVMPSERKEAHPAPAPVQSPFDARLEHFRPQEVSIPEAPKPKFTPSNPVPPVPSQPIKETPLPEVAPPVPAPPRPIPPIPPRAPKVEKMNVFRIKPSRE